MYTLDICHSSLLCRS